ncbi:MAG: SAM-dependent chlorinase/fluorinase [Thermoplasmata archaeon]|nr:SAM-dependent chlorinase/fluorinase [Thermoplasmata archaeon]
MPPRRTGRRRLPGLVTLTSDLGWEYAAQVKGALLRACPTVPLVDLTHELPRHRISEAAFILRAMATSFPPGTIHLAVVDPGVGGHRAPIAIRCGEGSVLVGPDNGVLAPLALALGRPVAYRLDPHRIEPRGRVGTTFDGRDLFAPAAARIARGEPLARLGTRAPFEDRRLPEALRAPRTAMGEVVHVDHFGNLISNVPSEWIPPRATGLTVSVGRRKAVPVPWVTSYESLGRGRLGTLGSSFGTAEVAVATGRAALRLRARTGTALTFRWGPRGIASPERVNSAPSLRRRRR